MHSKAVFSHHLEINLQRAITLSNASKVVLITDKNTHKWCKPLLSSISFELHYELPVGEANKNLTTLEGLLSFLTTNKADKKTLSELRKEDIDNYEKYKKDLKSREEQGDQFKALYEYKNSLSFISPNYELESLKQIWNTWKRPGNL